ncbi:DUF4328 domain-containing protein [Streptomyces sp. NPDC048603]|uniref:DUF4328 domain-containing protein n=1 Tax=Streptomyces sp. NPDC048603 TaxID=3365577 RepID=UPI003722DF69
MSADVFGPPSSEPVPAHPAPLPPATRPVQGLATALTVLFYVVVAAQVASVAAGVRVHLAAHRVITEGPGAGRELDSADRMLIVVGGAQGVPILATGVVFLIWFYRVRVNGGMFRPDGFFRRTSGWAVAAWFLPFANLVMPYGIAKDTWHASTQYGPGGEYREVATAPVTAWWTAWAVGSVFDYIADEVYGVAESAEQVRSAALFGAVGDLLILAAALLAIRFVQRLTAMQQVMSAEGPRAAA